MADVTALAGQAAAAASGRFSGIANLFAGIFANRRAKKLKEGGLDKWKESMDFTDYTIPQSYTDELGLRKTQMRQEMPGYSQHRQDIDSATASTLSSSQNLGGADSAAVLLGAGQDRLRALRGLGIQASQYGQRQQEGYTQAVGRGAQFENMAFDYNQWIPQQQFANTITAERNMGNQMMSSGFDQMLGAGIQGANMANQQQWYNNMQPQQGGGNQGGSMNPAWQGPQYNWNQNSWDQGNNNQSSYNMATGQWD